MAPEMVAVRKSMNLGALTMEHASATSSPALDMFSAGQLLTVSLTGVFMGETYFEAFVFNRLLCCKCGGYALRRRAQLSAPARALIKAVTMPRPDERATAVDVFDYEWLK
jgi:hypothetical protein